MSTLPEGFCPKNYLSRSWALLTMHRGWWKAVLALAAASLVPIVGPIGGSGYIYDWGRLTAWGINTAPKQKGVDIGACLKTGLRAVVVAFVYNAIIHILLDIIVSIIPGLESLYPIALLCVSIFASVAALYSTIYQSYAAGFKIKIIWSMVRKDPKGLLRILGMNIVLAALAAVVVVPTVLIPFSAIIVSLIVMAADGYNADVSIAASQFATAFETMTRFIPIFAVVCYIVIIITVVTQMLMTTATGLWMRQFDVPSWKSMNDPIPNLDDSPETAYHEQQNTPANPYAGLPASTEATAPTAPSDLAPTPYASTNVMTITHEEEDISGAQGAEDAAVVADSTKVEETINRELSEKEEALAETAIEEGHVTSTSYFSEEDTSDNLTHNSGESQDER